jgi:hypothetical protein
MMALRQRRQDTKRKNILNFLFAGFAALREQYTSSGPDNYLEKIWRQSGKITD